MLRRSLRSLESKLKPCRFGSALGLHCARCGAATVRSFVLALSALHLTHSDTPRRGYEKFYFGTPSCFRTDGSGFIRTRVRRSGQIKQKD